MKSYTIRLEDDEVEKMEQEAERLGFSSRTEYMRHILRNRDAVKPSTADSLDDRLSDLEEKVNQIESKLEE